MCFFAEIRKENDVDQTRKKLDLQTAAATCNTTDNGIANNERIYVQFSLNTTPLIPAYDDKKIYQSSKGRFEKYARRGVLPYETRSEN